MHWIELAWTCQTASTKVECLSLTMEHTLAEARGGHIDTQVSAGLNRMGCLDGVRSTFVDVETTPSMEPEDAHIGISPLNRSRRKAPCACLTSSRPASDAVQRAGHSRPNQATQSLPP